MKNIWKEIGKMFDPPPKATTDAPPPKDKKPVKGKGKGK